MKKHRFLYVMILLFAVNQFAFANNLVPFPLLEFHPFWNWDITSNTIIWSVANFIMAVLIEGFFYMYKDVLKNPILISLYVNSVTTATGFIFGMIGVILIQSDNTVSFFAGLLIPVIATIITEYCLALPFRKTVNKIKFRYATIAANVLSNSIIITLILIKKG